MKKTLIALMAMAGVACGYTDAVWTLDGSLSATGTDATFKAQTTQTVQVDDGQGGKKEVTQTVDATASYINSNLVGYGKALDLNGNTWITTGSSEDEWNGLNVGTGGSSFSVVMTLRFDDFITSGDKEMYIFGTGTNNGNGLALHVNEGVVGLTTKGKYHRLFGNTALSENTWYTLAVTYDQTTGNAILYVNGVKQGNTLTGLNALTTTDTNNSKAYTVSGGGLSIGSASVGQQGTWDGAIADFRIYDNVLTAQEVSTIGAPKSIPEPTAATLSLLALAGLAARRRRK